MTTNKIIYDDPSATTQWNNTFWTYVRQNGTTTYFNLVDNGGKDNKLGTSGTC